MPVTSTETIFGAAADAEGILKLKPSSASSESSAKKRCDGPTLRRGLKVMRKKSSSNYQEVLSAALAWPARTALRATRTPCSSPFAGVLARSESLNVRLMKRGSSPEMSLIGKAEAAVADERLRRQISCAHAERRGGILKKLRRSGKHEEV